jgi:hypothetical protein
MTRSTFLGGGALLTHFPISDAPHPTPMLGGCIVSPLLHCLRCRVANTTAAIIVTNARYTYIVPFGPLVPQCPPFFAIQFCSRNEKQYREKL